MFLSKIEVLHFRRECLNKHYVKKYYKFSIKAEKVKNSVLSILNCSNSKEGLESKRTIEIKIAFI